MKIETKHIILTAAGIILCIIAGMSSAGAEETEKKRLKISFAERFRFEAWDNAINLDDTSDEGFTYARNKTTLGLQWAVAEGLEFAGKLTNEHRIYLAPKDRNFDWHEAFFDNLYVKWKLPGNLPFTITAGRQDIFLGEGFVVADATALDGSRSFYFNALRVDYDLSPDHKILAFYHAMNKTDTFLPVINDLDKQLLEQPERALALYYSGDFGIIKADAYCIWKNIRQTGPETAGSAFGTVGARILTPIWEPLLLTVEGACQRGSFGSVGRRAFGGISHLDFTPEWKIPFLRTLILGGIYLSGDRPETDRLEAWDPLFSRWPKWSNGYLLTFSRESRPAYWSNMTSVYGSILLDFGSRANATLTLHRLGANESHPGIFPGGDGLKRGILMVNQLNFIVSRHLSGHLKWENFQPGDFYFPGASGFNWVRFHLLFSY